MSTRPAAAAPLPAPVAGSAQPPRGASGALRRLAYAVPEHRARHWLLLIAADRIDVLEHRLRERPALAPAVLLGLVGGFALVRALRGRD